jgi:hypothetical protein
MKILIETIDPKKMRYPTVGDYFQDGDTFKIQVADMGNDNYNFLVALHELIESKLCQERGIKEEDITAFDLKYEKEREEGKHQINDEPGFDTAAPYRAEHTFANGVEMAMASLLGIDYNDYDKTVMNLDVGEQTNE